MDVRRQTIAWLVTAQAAATTSWWVVLIAAPGSRAYFEAPGTSVGVFGLADAVVIATMIAAAFAVWRGRAWAGAALWAAAGGIGYAALCCVSQWLATGAAGLAVAMMIPSAVLAVGLAVAGSRA